MKLSMAVTQRAAFLLALATGLFAQKLVNPGGADGLLYGNPKQFLIQLLAVVVVFAWGFVTSTIILKLLDLVMGLRVTPEEEEVGLDVSQHGEYAYWPELSAGDIQRGGG